ncbi:MAG: competence/damage-inducible protein A [Gemmatimonadaceae bacterium]|nr:competence/damage-inducible protein A [Gemmatimonadaceae bacterium]
MNIEIVTIGDELLLGFTIDTNAAHLARELAALGIRIARRTTVGDEPGGITTAIREALERTGAVITTGGLGPTADDRTKPAIAEIFGRGMVLDQSILENLQQRWLKRFGVEMPDSNRQQAMVPERATILGNKHGSAPGIWLEDSRNRWVAMLPGVPREMRGMLADTLLPRIRDRVTSGGAVVRSLTLRTASISESAIADKLGELGRGVDGFSLAFLPGVEGVDLRLTSTAYPAEETDRRLAVAATKLREIVGRFVYGEGDVDLAALMIAECIERHETIAVAESCTGGLLGARLTAIPGSSAVVQGGVIAYANEVKTRELGVPSDVLVAEGAVSEPVARAMASGVRVKFGTTIGIGITGIAGPSGGSPEKPVGTVWIAVDVAGDVHAIRAVIPGDRAEIRQRGAQLALDRLRRAFLRDAASEGWTVRA